MKIDLNAPWIKLTNGENYISIDATQTGAVTSTNTSKAPFKIGSKFSVAWDGTIYATGGNFEGHIDATSGTLDDLTITGDLSVYMDTWDNNGKKGPVFLYNTNQTLMGYMGFLNGDDGKNNTHNIGIKSLNAHGIVFEAATNARLSATDGIFIEANSITFKAVAEHQHGIYARFA